MRIELNKRKTFFGRGSLKQSISRTQRIALALAGAVLVILGAVTPASAAGYDLTTAGSSAKIDDAVYRSFVPTDPSGSGVFDAFVRVSANTPVVQGYNTSERPLEFDENTSPTFTKSYLLSDVPIVGDPDHPGVYREFQLDINQLGSAPFLSLDEVEIYLTNDSSITGYPFVGNAAKVYELDAGGADNWVLLNYNNNTGSGKRDLALRVPDARFQGSGYPYCEYQATGCNTYIVFYTRFGGDAGASYVNNDGFEEWGVAIYDLATKSGMKFNDLNANGVKDAGEPGLPGWSIFVDLDNNSQESVGEPSGVTDASGNYTITNIISGTYTVREVQQPGWTCSYPNNGTTDLQTQPVVSSACFYQEQFGPGSTHPNNNFGNYQDGSLTVTKAIDWNSWAPDGTSFQICVSGPSHQSGDCKSISTNGSLTWNNLQPGTYTVTETSPGVNWTVSGSGVGVNIPSGGTGSTTITNTKKMNPVTVTKTATTTYTREFTYTWDIVKNVTPTEVNLFEGESQVLTYTVDVTPTLSSQSDGGHQVGGTITVLNPGPADTAVASVSDVVASLSPAASVTCTGVVFPKVLTAGQSFTCTYTKDLSGAISGLNVATAVLSNTTPYSGTANVTFGDPTTVITNNIPISVTDTYTIDGSTSSESLGTNISASWSKTYTRTAECGTSLNYVDGAYNYKVDNTARINETGDEDSASVPVGCYQPLISKTAVPTTDYKWTIDKSVTPTQTHLFEGDSQQLNYVVTVTRTVPPGGYQIDGTITVTNPNPSKGLVVNQIVDQLDTGQALAVTNCPTPLTIPGGGSQQCNYNGSLDSKATVTNTATVTAATGIAYSSAGIEVDFLKASSDPTITVTDTQPSSTAPWTFTDSGSQSYTYQAVCDDNNFSGGNSYDITVNNRATIEQTDEFADATATVTCWRLLVSKTANPSYTQPYTWTIDKAVDKNLIELIPGQTGTANYTVTVTKQPLPPTNLLVAGSIKVENPAPIAATLQSVQDAVNGTSASVSCPSATFPYQLPAAPTGNVLDCSYSHVPGNLIFNGQNVATATLSNNTNFTGSAPVDFTNAVVTEVLPQVDVTDTNLAGTKWTFTNSGSQKYPITFNCADAVYNENNVSTFVLDNTATIVETGASDSQSVTRICRVGDLEVTKVVDWQGNAPDNAQTFEICVTGPSFPSANCKTIGANGGKLTWENVIPGKYTVTETNPGAEWTVVGSGVTVDVAGGSVATTTVTNRAAPPASLGDFVWVDSNQNGIQDSGEPGLQGVTVSLFGAGTDAQCWTGDDVSLATTTTDANGLYRFNNLAAGDYCVAFQRPTGYLFTPANQGGDDTVDSDADASTGRTTKTSLVAGEVNLTVDAGVFPEPAPKSSISNFVWNDVNQDGIQNDGADSAFAGITVTLLDPGPDNQCATGDETVLKTTTTDASGEYIFSDLDAGKYCVAVELPDGYQFTEPNVGNDVNLDSDVDPDTGQTTVIALPDGTDDPTWDVGIHLIKPTGLDQENVPQRKGLYLPLLTR